MYYWGLAAEQDCPKAIHALSLMYEHGLGVKQHTKRADELRDLAAFCWTQQAQPAPGQIGNFPLPIDLPDWLKKPDGNFPSWKERNFVAAKRAPPLLLKKYGTGKGPTAVKQLMGDNVTSYSYAPSSEMTLSSTSIPSTSAPPTSSLATLTASPSSTPIDRSPSPTDRRRTSDRRPISPSKESRSSEFLARIERIQDDVESMKIGDQNIQPKQQSVFALNYKDRHVMPHMQLKSNKVVAQVRPPRTASPIKTTRATPAISSSPSQARPTQGKSTSSPTRTSNSVIKSPSSNRGVSPIGGSRISEATSSESTSHIESSIASISTPGDSIQNSSSVSLTSTPLIVKKSSSPVKVEPSVKKKTELGVPASKKKVATPSRKKVTTPKSREKNERTPLPKV